MIDLGNLRGGPDNITVVIVKVTGPAITNQPAEPLALAGDKAEPTGPPPVNKALWAAAILAIAAAVGLSQVGWIYAVAAAMIAGALITWGVLQRLTGGPDVRYLAPGARLGRGPYAACDSTPNQAIVHNLELLCDQLREAANDGRWSVDWTRFNAYSSQGKAALARHEYLQAIREFGRAQRFMINELRNQGRKRPTPDSSSDVLSHE